MYSTPAKKMLILNLLEILKKHSDENHPLSQKDIQEFLLTQYSMKVERKAVSRNLTELIECGYPIEYKEKTRHTYDPKTGKYIDSSILTDFFIEPDFSDIEINHMINSFVFSKHIPLDQRKELIQKIEKLTSKYYKSSYSHVDFLNESTSLNKELFLNLEIINEAIQQKKEITFIYNNYDIDKLLHPVEECSVFPYKIVAKNDHYYMICNEPPYDDLTHYRIDLMTDISEPGKRSKGDRFKNVDIKGYLNTHLYMFTGTPQYVEITVDRTIIGNVIESFGSDFTILNSGLETATLRVKSNLDDMYYWALQLGDYVTVISPQELRDRLRETVKTMSRTYYKTKEDKIQRAISQSQKSGSLYLSNQNLTKHTEVLSSLNNTKKVILFRCTDKNNFSFLTQYNDLETLGITMSSSESLKIVGRLKNLKRLYLNNIENPDLNCLDNLKQLTFLIIRNKANIEIKNVEQIYKLKTLKILHVDKNTLSQIDVERLKREIPEVKLKNIGNHFVIKF